MSKVSEVINKKENENKEEIKVSDNILQPLFDSIWNLGKQVYNMITKNEIKSFVPFELKPTSKDSIYIYLGNGIKGDIYINLKENPNSFIVGTTGSGKSVCVKSIITSLVNNYSPNQLELILCDLKRVELNIFRNLEHVSKFVYKIDDVTQTINEVLEECENRYDLFMKRNVTNIFEYNKISNKKLKFKILFIEEIVLLLQDKKKVAINDLKQLLSICRASGVYVFITTQRPSADVLDPVIKSVINNRIVFKVEDSANSNICLDQEGAELLEGKGHGLLKVGSFIQEFRGYFLSDDDCKELIKPHIRKEPIKVTSKQVGFVETKKENQVDDLDFLKNL